MRVGGRGAVCLRGSGAETGSASPQLNSNSCLLLRAIGWLYAVFPKLRYQKFNNSRSALLLLMRVCP